MIDKEKQLTDFAKFLASQEKGILKEKPLKVPEPPVIIPVLKFHHNQKVKIVSGYYNTFKGYIRDTRRLKDGNKINNEYLIEIIIKSDDDNQIKEWLSEKDIKTSMW